MPVPRSDLSTKKIGTKQGTGMKNLVELFCDVDDFCKVFIPQWRKQLLEDGTRKRQRDCRMSMSEIMTVIIGFTPRIIVILKIIIWDWCLFSIKRTFLTYSVTHDFWK